MRFSRSTGVVLDDEEAAEAMDFLDQFRIDRAL
jgi:hypothetical protein